MSRRVVWFFGRGLSIGCGLTWDVPRDFQSLERHEKIKKIREALLAEMDAPGVCTKGLRQFLEFLSQHTTPGWDHLFLTTNWDFLLQRELLRFISDENKPTWLSDSHVFHLNGTIEQPLDNSFRSPFLLPKDFYAQRTSTAEANIALNGMIWGDYVVVVGMSFECGTDRFFLQQLNQIEDFVPVGESEWVVVNPDSAALKAACERIQNALPGARVLPVCLTVEQWQEQGFGELRRWGAFSL